MTELSNEILVAYIDGELTAEQCRSIEAALTRDPEARAKIDRLRATPLPIREAFDHLLEAPLPPGLAEQIMTDGSEPSGRDQTAARGVWSGGRMAVAASLFALAIGLGGGYLAGLYGGRVPESALGQASWVTDVAHYQKFYVRETVQGVAFDRQQTRDLERRLSSRLGFDVAVPDLSGQGLTFRRGQLLMLDDRPVAQLVYLPETGLPVALCIIGTQEADRGASSGAAEGLRFVSWRKAGAAFVVIGKADKRLLDGVARQLAAGSET